MRVFYLALLLFAAGVAPAQTGVNWSPGVSIAASHYGNLHPRVVADKSGNPLIIWGSGSVNKVNFVRWTGTAFSNPVSLNPDSIPIFTASWAGPDLAARGDTVYVVYKETPEDGNGIFLVRSINGGINFSPPVRVDAIADSISRFPAVTAGDAGNPLVAFMKFDPGFTNARYVVTRSGNAGNSFGPDVPASRYSGGYVCDCCPATVLAAGNTAAVLYRDNLSNLRNNWAGFSFDNGNSFGASANVDNTGWIVNSCPASGPDGVLVGDGLYAVFMSAASGKSLCYRSRTAVASQQLETVEPLTGNFAGLGQQNYPRIAASGSAAAVVWTQTVNGSAQLAVQFTDNLSNGFPAGYATLAAQNVADADVALANGKIYVVWEDAGSGTVRYMSGTYATSGTPNLPGAGAAMQVYPNPVTQAEIAVRIDAPEGAGVAYTIVNLQGQELRSGHAQQSAGLLRIDVSGLRQGAYWLRVGWRDRVWMQPLIKE